MRRYALILPLLLLIACTDNDLKKVAKGLQITATSMAELQKTVINLNTAGLISESDTRSILQVCIEVNKAGADAVAITRGIAKLDKPTRGQILTILIPVIAALDGAVARTNGIKNEQTRLQIRAILLTAESALNTVQIVIAGGE